MLTRVQFTGVGLAMACAIAAGLASLEHRPVDGESLSASVPSLVGCLVIPDDVSGATLRVVYDRMPRVSASGVSSGLHTKQHIDKQRAEIEQIRAWLPSQHDPCVVAAYSKWLDYYARRADEADAELRNGTIRAKQDAYMKERDTEEQQINKAYGRLPKPPR